MVGARVNVSCMLSPAASQQPASNGDDLTAQKLRRLDELESHFEQLLQQAKLEAMYHLAAGAGHEINNPLGSIAGWAQLLLRDEKDPERRRSLARINAQAFRAHEMIADLMLFARPPEPVKAPFDLVTLVDEVISRLADEAAQQQTQLARREGPGAIPVVADRVQLATALRAVCVNALEAIGAGGHVHVTVRNESVDGTLPAGAAIVVEDTGPGIAPHVRPHLFDPFYCGREAGRGLGLGLSKCWRIVTNHGGRIDVHSEAGQGARFTIYLPAAVA
jgi:signal transduction histidine kinase